MDFETIQWVARAAAWGLWVAFFFAIDTDSRWSKPTLVAAVISSFVSCSTPPGV